MKTTKRSPIVLALYGLFSIALPSCLAQGTIETSSEIFEKVKDSIISLDDGQNSAYGICLSRARRENFVYVLSASQLSLGIEKRIRGVLLDGKAKVFKAERLSPDAVLNMAIYKIESPPKNLTPLTRIPQDSLHTDDVVWALGPPAKPRELARFRVVSANFEERLIELVGDFSNTFLGSPVFDLQGRIAGCVTNSGVSLTQPQPELHEAAQVASISSLLKYAAEVLKDFDFYPVWKEVYPSQYAVDQVMESVALLDTKKSGAGIVLGWRFAGKDTMKTGYVLTAFHVVADESLPF